MFAFTTLLRTSALALTLATGAQAAESSAFTDMIDHDIRAELAQMHATIIVDARQDAHQLAQQGMSNIHEMVLATQPRIERALQREVVAVQHGILVELQQELQQWADNVMQDSAAAAITLMREAALGQLEVK
ncbi:hypothetical protein [Ferrimonas gelatinilytica]|uniref:Uncharacterized protein n=1 Tax=Ferrimonas gelatinilytica TaxID=1255257 RepID=A0ABP9S804_9GAMM